MKPAPTLIDHLYRASFSNERNLGWTDNSLWRDALRRARRFVLDDEMSTFLGELGTQAFVSDAVSPPDLTPKDIARLEHRKRVRNRMVDHLRLGARLPSDITWIEYNLRKCQARSNELLNNRFNPAQSPKMEGWLLMRHPHLPTAFRAHVLAHDPDIDHGDGFDTWTFPVALAWTADMDTVLPWHRIPFGEQSNTPSEILTGLLGYKTERAAFVFSDMIVTPNKPKEVANLLREWSGVQRRMWALLSTINDLPVLIQDVKASKGFMGRREYRRFLDHKTITLTVPQKLYRKTIRNALAMAHRRGGPVRSHWRKDWRHPLSALCNHDDWTADEKHMICKHCHGRKIWIDEHVRGDTSKGFVTHDFIVTHKEP